MSLLLRVLGLALLASLAGCSGEPGKAKEVLDVTGTVVGPDGKPVKDVTLNLLPTESGQRPASVQLKADGKFMTQLAPGKYDYVFEGKALRSVPAKYHTADSAHTVTVPAGGGGAIEIKLES